VVDLVDKEGCKKHALMPVKVETRPAAARRHKKAVRGVQRPKEILSRRESNSGRARIASCEGGMTSANVTITPRKMIDVVLALLHLSKQLKTASDRLIVSFGPAEAASSRQVD
jgi:hypothetical protein